jgi:hypothetical protein
MKQARLKFTVFLFLLVFCNPAGSGFAAEDSGGSEDRPLRQRSGTFHAFNMPVFNGRGLSSYFIKTLFFFYFFRNRSSCFAWSGEEADATGRKRMEYEYTFFSFLFRVSLAIIPNFDGQTRPAVSGTRTFRTLRCYTRLES